MTSPSIGEALTKSVAARTEDWSEVEALLAVPVDETPVPAAAKRRPMRLALGLVALAALGGGAAALKATITPGCHGDACEARLEAAAPAQPAIRDVTVTPLVVAAAEPLPQPIQQGRSIASLPPAQVSHPAPRLRPHPVHVAAKPARVVARGAVPAPVRRPVAVSPELIAHAGPAPRLVVAQRPMLARHPMRAMVARPVRLQQVFLSPNRYTLVERR